MDLDALPKTSDALSAYEILLSETQERMLASVKPENLEGVLRVLKGYPTLTAAVIGEIVSDKTAKIQYQGELAADLPVEFVVDGFIRFEIPNEKIKTEPSEVANVVVQEDLAESALVFTTAEWACAQCF